MSITAETETARVDHPAQGSKVYLWYVVLLLTLAQTLSIIDRQVLNVMIGPVKRDLGGLSDIEVSFIMGFAFTFFYSALSYPAGWLADRYNRRNLMAGGIAAWSVMTILCGMAGTYWQLFVARMGVGVGEATLSPAANSTLADLFSPRNLPLALGVVAAAPFIGQGLANIVGGPLIDYLEATPNIAMPLIGEVHSWQYVFIVVGAPGLILAVVLMGMREPKRFNKLTEHGRGVPFSEVWAFVRERWLFFALAFLAYLCLSVQGWSLFGWIVEHYVREHQWTRTQIGLSYGFIAMFVGIIGSIFAGALAGRMIARGTQDAPLRLVFYGSLLLIPTAPIITFTDSAWTGIAMLVPVTFWMAMPSGLMMATLQAVAPNELRGQAVAFYLISVNFLAYTFAPSLPPVVSRIFWGSEAGLGDAISALAIINYTIAAVSIGYCLRYFRDALNLAKKWQETH